MIIHVNQSFDKSGLSDDASVSYLSYINTEGNSCVLNEFQHT